MTIGAAVPMMATMKALPPMSFTCQAGGVGGGRGVEDGREVGDGRGEGGGGGEEGGGGSRLFIACEYEPIPTSLFQRA